MASFQAATPEDVAQRTGRRCKTDPLRDAVLAMEIGDCIFIPYFDEKTAPDGFKPNTVTQVVGGLSRTSATVRYAVRRDITRPGAFVLCLTRRTPEEIAANAERREKRKARAKSAA